MYSLLHVNHTSINIFILKVKVHFLWILRPLSAITGHRQWECSEAFRCLPTRSGLVSRSQNKGLVALPTLASDRGQSVGNQWSERRGTGESEKPWIRCPATWISALKVTSPYASPSRSHQPFLPSPLGSLPNTFCPLPHLLKPHFAEKPSLRGSHLNMPSLSWFIPECQGFYNF